MEVTELYEYDGKRTHFTVDAVIIDSGKLPRSVVVPKALEATSEIYEGWFDLVNGTAPRKEEVVSKQWALDSQTILGSLLAIAFTIMVVNMYTVSLCLDGLSKMSMILAKMQ